MKTDFSWFDYRMLTVELNATDEQLKVDFEIWLKQQRETKSIKREKMFTDKDIAKWRNNKILPYLDLTLIARAEGIKLTQHALGKMLFPEEYDVDLTERIRRTIKPMADLLLSTDYRNALEIQQLMRKEKTPT